MAEERREVPSRDVTEKAETPARTEPKHDTPTAYETMSDGGHDRRHGGRRERPDRRAAAIPEEGTLQGVQFSNEELDRMKRGEVVAKEVGWGCFQYFGGPNMDLEIKKRLRLPNGGGSDHMC